MPQNSTISNLPEDIGVTIADYVAIVTPGSAQTKKAKLANILALATGAGAPNFIGKFASLVALQSYLPAGADGNYAVVTASPNDEEYIWDSDHNAWVKTENVPASTFALLGGNAADNASLAAELSARDTAISTESVIRTNADANLQSQVSALSAALIPHPTYVNPTAGISSSQSTGGLEVGQTINIPLTATYNQNDGGSQTGLSIKKNGTQIATTSPYTDSGVVVSATPVTYQSSVTFGQGAVKNNILGIADATGRIAAGSVNSSNLSYQGFYKVFYDAVSSFPTNSASARALGNTRFSNSGNTFTLNTGSTFTKFCVVLPPGKTLVSVIDQDALNLDITSQYTSASISVNDAAGTAVAYTIWSMSQSVPYSSNHRHNITIA
ncbi:hypothetical protein BEL04_14525 [Mucilaginibacter sp. PPCGB 2223]|uniref:hypothetical protein n=1 Tax=Mucilaginibacter sp. PPCGB 2223 TaxID=1886027 RepID=UPI000824E800|nr:hypothetical protein [Mucilaginibacter sp. PPCGB 2223]OCX52658.1 hypothetical protein BEL04_14525 [Mucilaginibacter sp. PPCGB 2223]